MPSGFVHNFPPKNSNDDWEDGTDLRVADMESGHSCAVP